MHYPKGLRLVAFAIFCAFHVAAAQAQSLQDAAAIRPAADELKWRKIPWLLDLSEGARVAQAERRPIFLWVTGDDPLERC